MLIVEFVFVTHCILTQWQGKPELPDSPQLLHRDTTFSIGMPIYAKSTIARLPLGRYAPTLRINSIFLSFGSIVRPNYLMLSFLEGTFYCAGRSEIPTRRKFGFMHVQSLHQYLIPTYIWYGDSLMESFTLLLQRLVILQVSQCFVEVDARFWGELIRNTNVDTEQQSTTTTRWEGRQTSALGTPEQPLC